MRRRTPSRSVVRAEGAKSASTRASSARTRASCAARSERSARPVPAPRRRSPAPRRFRPGPRARRHRQRPSGWLDADAAALIVASNCARLKGSTPAPASAPKSTALITLPLRFGGLRPCRSGRSASRRPAAWARSARAVDPAVAHRALLGDRIDAMGRRDQRGALGRDQAALHGAAASISSEASTTSTSPGSGISASTGSPPSASACALRIELDVVDGRAGALRHARHRRGLGEIAVGFAHLDDPVGEHAAALAAHGEDGDLDRLVSHSIALQNAYASRGAWPRAAAASRSRAGAGVSRRRSQRLGLLTICAL